MVLPGPEAQQLATYIGWLMHGTAGGIVAGVLFVLPSLLILILVSWLYLAFGNLPLVAGLFAGIKPAVTAVVLHAAWRIGSRALKNPFLWLLAGASFIASAAFSVPFPVVVLAAAAAGWFGNRLAPQAFHGSSGHGKTRQHHGPALIDDDTVRPAHAHHSSLRLLRTVAAGLLLWLPPPASSPGSPSCPRSFSSLRVRLPSNRAATNCI